MEASRVVMRPGIDAWSQRNSYYHHCSSSSSCAAVAVVRRQGRRKQVRSGFCDQGQLWYYGGGRIGWVVGGGVGGGKRQPRFSLSGVRGEQEIVMDKEKEEKKNKKIMKKRLKLLKGLTKDLSMFFEDDNLVDQVKANPKMKMISEASELLRGELRKLKTQEKELKRKKKKEVVLSRAASPLHNRLECVVSSSSSSDSSDSDSDCETVQDVIDMNCFTPVSDPNKMTVIEKNGVEIPYSIPMQEVYAMSLMQTLKSNPDDRICRSSGLIDQERCGEATGKYCGNVGGVGEGEKNGLVTGFAEKKIEVCVGGKCKKLGSALVLEEFKKVAEVDVMVSGCKCMGKCRDGPNVRVVNDTTNPLCVGVGLEDVGLILSNFFGQNQIQNQNQPALAASN